MLVSGGRKLTRKEKESDQADVDRDATGNHVIDRLDKVAANHVPQHPQELVETEYMAAKKRCQQQLKAGSNIFQPSAYDPG
eukprot:Skav217746  [mRNA]  locus=scaffold7254:9069:9414:+ [translate_table: standard]